MEMDPRAVRKESERTMRYMILIAASETSRKELDEASGPELAAAYRRYTEELRKAGVLLGGDALHTSERGARVGVTNGRRSVTDGPFSEAKEVVGGYFLIQVKSKEEAIEWAARCPAAQYAPRSYCEVREIMEVPTNLRPPSADLEESPS